MNHNATLTFSEPMEVTYSTNVRTLLPKMADIPKEFDDHFNKWNRAVSKWFFEGIKKEAFTIKEGIDKEKAFKHLAAIISSWDLKHEHKEAGAAYLMSLWFKDGKLKP